MTNTHCIQDLELIEESLRDILTLEKSNADISNFLQLTYDRFSQILPEVTHILLLDDIAKAKENGLTLRKLDIQRLSLGELTIDKLIETEIAA